MKQPKTIPNPLYCESCDGLGYLVADAEWKPIAVQCPECKDRRSTPGEPVQAAVDRDDDQDRMVKIGALISRLQSTMDQFGDTCVYIRRGGLSWGAVALNRRDDDQKHGVFDLQAQHDRDMLQRVGQVERLIADKNRWMERAIDAEAKASPPLPSTPSEPVQAAVKLGDIVRFNATAPYASEWRGVELEVVSLRMAPGGALWVSVVETEDRMSHRGNGYYDGETTDIPAEHLSLVPSTYQSVPVQRAPHNHGERLPNGDTAGAGADTRLPGDVGGGM